MSHGYVMLFITHMHTHTHTHIQRHGEDVPWQPPASCPWWGWGCNTLPGRLYQRLLHPTPFSGWCLSALCAGQLNTDRQGEKREWESFKKNKNKKCTSDIKLYNLVIGQKASLYLQRNNFRMRILPPKLIFCLDLSNLGINKWKRGKEESEKGRIWRRLSVRLHTKRETDTV